MQTQKELRELSSIIKSTKELAERLDQKMAVYLLSMASLEITQTIKSIQEPSHIQKLDS